MDNVSYLVEGVSQEERERNSLPYVSLGQVEAQWSSLENFFVTRGIKAIIRSSSEDVLERNVENLASQAANDRDIPVFVVEDFPGNYWHEPGNRLDSLFVEDGSLVGLHETRGVDPNDIYITGNPRYNWLQHVDRRGRRKQTRKTFGLEDEPVMLWAGQPDGENSYLALNRLLSSFKCSNITLFFRAHPRDKAYATGKYDQLLASTSMSVLDASSYPDPLGLYCASDLVMTQFSSAGVEASHLGVPALFVLFDDLGKQYLRSYKGYDKLPWCSNGCSFLVEREEDIGEVMERALFDNSSLEEALANFRRAFGNSTDSARAIAERVRDVVYGNE